MLQRQCRIEIQSVAGGYSARLADGINLPGYFVGIQIEAWSEPGSRDEVTTELQRVAQARGLAHVPVFDV